MDAPLFFANAGYFSQKLDEAEEAMWCASRKAEAAGSLGGVVHYVVIEMAPVATVDATGAQALLEVAKARMQRGVRVVLANPNRGALGLLERSGVTDYIGKEWVFFRAHEAVHACREALAEVDSPTAVPIRKHGRGEGGGDEDLDGAPGGVQEPCGLLYGVTVDAIRKARLRPHGHPATSV